MAQKRPDRALGPGHDEFWTWCGKGELRLQRCEQCGALAWPVVQTCEACGSAALRWERMSGRGKIVSWCSFERDYYGGLLPLPWDTILVELEEGVLFISNPEGFTCGEARFEMAVALTFIDCEDTAGAYSLPVFKKA
jgi:uncharacterized OB-fold protein